MPDIPQDPRQLAKDILSGKISIEDLAREQQRRRGMAVPPKQPERYVPLPRQAPPVQQPQARIPPATPLPPRQPMPQRPQPQPARPLPSQTSRSLPRQPMPPRQSMPQRQPAPLQRRDSSVQTRPAAVVAAPAATGRRLAVEPEVPKLLVAQPLSMHPTSIDPRTRKPVILTLLRDRNTVRHGILLAEILGPPVGLR